MMPRACQEDRRWPWDPHQLHHKAENGPGAPKCPSSACRLCTHTWPPFSPSNPTRPLLLVLQPGLGHNPEEPRQVPVAVVAVAMPLVQAVSGRPISGPEARRCTLHPVVPRPMPVPVLAEDKAQQNGCHKQEQQHRHDRDDDDHLVVLHGLWGRRQRS
ncbi:hypothetical protein HPG69_018827 [Diceros bicornis minor]|uniref:Uncharacterized protein n=1 Tax=Diceros bicornis minor TaxID=77932 RepID=A0A7J7F9Q5_DICBM|nr:hypothetical protein HPG69_018827 [Diceros bicornis minor]